MNQTSAQAFCVDKTILGTEKHLVVDGGFSWVEELPHNVWQYSGVIKNDCDLCFDTLLKLGLIDVNAHPPPQFEKAMKALVKERSIVVPWQKIMPKQAHVNFVRTIVDTLVDSLGNAPVDYYVNTWVKEMALLRSLVPAHVNERLRQDFLSSCDNPGSLESFSLIDEVTKPIVYDRFGTRTGRLTVTSGPMILTLKKDHRQILTSSWGDDGDVVMFDFNALEPRIALYESGGDCSDSDLYDAMNVELFERTLERDVVKGGVISAIYGQSGWALAKRFNLDNPHEVVGKIAEYFKAKELLNAIKNDYVINGAKFIRNKYGRSILIDEPSDRVLINSYVQSTGVDVALLGFYELMNKIRGFRVKPLFVLVDALIIDCHKDDLSDVQHVTSINVDGYDQAWNLKMTMMNTH